MIIIDDNWIYKQSTTGINKDVKIIITGDIDSDYVKIVRCKNCKYEQYRHYSRFCINENGKCYGLEVTEDFYCADGERRDTNG